MVVFDNITFKDFTVRQNENHKILLALTCWKTVLCVYLP